MDSMFFMLQPGSHYHTSSSSGKVTPTPQATTGWPEWPHTHRSPMHRAKIPRIWLIKYLHLHAAQHPSILRKVEQGGTGLPTCQALLPLIPSRCCLSGRDGVHSVMFCDQPAGVLCGLPECWPRWPTAFACNDITAQTGTARACIRC